MSLAKWRLRRAERDRARAARSLATADVRAERAANNACWWGLPLGHVWGEGTPGEMTEGHWVSARNRCVNCGWEPDSYTAENSTARVWALYGAIAWAAAAAYVFWAAMAVVEAPIAWPLEGFAMIGVVVGVLYLLIGGFACLLLLGAPFGHDW